jgi:hypothetical protein
MVNVPVVDHSPMWAHLKRTHEKSEEGANEVCCQAQSSQQFHLIAQLRDDGKLQLDARVPDNFDSSREWLERKGALSCQSAFNGIAKHIATIV